jgi:MIP family channel proteins
MVPATTLGPRAAAPNAVFRPTAAAPIAQARVEQAIAPPKGLGYGAAVPGGWDRAEGSIGRGTAMDQGFKSTWAEFLGTFTLCFIGQGAICTQQLLGPGDASLLTIAVAHGLALATMISALGQTSGAHFNPAVTFGFVLAGRQSLGSGVRYVVAQLFGAVFASLLLAACFPRPVAQAATLGAAAVHPDVPVGVALVIEFVLTFFLVWVVWGTAVDDLAHRIGGFGIGLTVTMGILLAGPLTGAAMNPARAFGPALVAGAWTHHWIWWVGPLLGGAAAAAR